MRHDDQRVGLGDGGRHFDFFKVLGVDLDLTEIVALEAVGDDQRRADLCVAEAVLDGGDQMIDGVLAAADVQRVAVGQKRLAAEFFHFIHDGAKKDRTQIRVVALFAEMQLDRREVVLLHSLAELDGFDGLFEHIDLADGGGERREIDG